MSNVVHRLCIYGYRLDVDPSLMLDDYRSLVAAKIEKIFSCRLLAVTTLRVRCFLGWLLLSFSIDIIYGFRVL